MSTEHSAKNSTADFSEMRATRATRATLDSISSLMGSGRRYLPAEKNCPRCDGSFFWRSAYDRALRCQKCDPPPDESLVAEWVGSEPEKPVDAACYRCGAGLRRQASIFGYEDLVFCVSCGAFCGRENDIWDRSYTAEEWWEAFGWMFGEMTEPDSDGQSETPCNRCGSRAYRDVPFHGGQRVRRDCARCGVTICFPVW